MAIVITEKNFDEIVASNKAVAVDCSAEWCGPCKMMHPVVEELAAEYEGKAVIGFLDVDECPDVCAEFGVMNIPTILYFKDGKLTDKTVGAMQKSDLIRHLNGILA